MTHFEHVLNHVLLRFLARPWLIVLPFLLLTLALSLMVKQVNFDSSVENFLAENNNERKIYTAFKNEYGLSEYFIVLIRGEQVFSRAFQQKLQRLTESIYQHVPYVKSVESIANVRYVKSSGEEIYISELFDGSVTEADFAAIKDIALTTPYYLNRLIDQDGEVTAVLVRLEPFIRDASTEPFRQAITEDGERSIAALSEVLAVQQASFSQPLLLGGSLASTIELSRLTKRDLKVFTVVAVLLICISLFTVFRRLSAVLLPLVSLIIAVVITMSLMMIGEFPMLVSNSILPSFLLAVCVGDSVHLMQAFYSSLDSGISRKKSVANALRHSSPAMFFTTLTTSIGVLSFASSDIASVSTFGIFASIGMWIAFFNTVLLLPALLILVPVAVKPKRYDKLARDLNLSRGLISVIAENKVPVMAVGAFSLAISILFALQLNFSHDVLKWFPTDNPSRVATEIIDEELTGTMQIELLISNTNMQNPDIVHGSEDKPAITLQQLNAIQQWLSELMAQPANTIKIQSSTSIIDILEETNKALTNQADYQLPDTQALYAQQLLLLMLDSAERVMSLSTDNMNTMRISLSTSWDDAVEYTAFLMSSWAGKI